MSNRKVIGMVIETTVPAEGPEIINVNVPSAIKEKPQFPFSVLSIRLIQKVSTYLSIVV